MRAPGLLKRLRPLAPRSGRTVRQRGSVLLFTVALLPMFLAMGGIAVDVAYFASARAELQRSMDAAALAGAGHLGFDTTVFPAARSAAQTYALLNPYRDLNSSTSLTAPSLNVNTANAPSGDIVLGVWDPRNPNGVGSGLKFAPSLDGTIVNAVLCQTQTTIPTTFLRLIGIDTLSLAAQAVAISNPPAGIPQGASLFPIAVSGCSFTGNSSTGCGAPVQFSPTPANTAAWANINGLGNPSASSLQGFLANAVAGIPQGQLFHVGDLIGVNNGMIDSVFASLSTDFVSQFNASAGNLITVKDSSGNVVYSGQGWRVLLPVIQTPCPPGPINSNNTILGWSYLTITQVIDKGTCVVVNHNPPGNVWDPLCGPPSKVSPSFRALYGFYTCDIIPSQPQAIPGPRTALGSRMKLVQ